tara:strand:- start:533 stop:1357 length:825 start_codon:yes stop_codon:yes gene_type:complete
MKPQMLKDALKWKLTSAEIEILPRAFDVVGSIAIFSDFPEELIRREGIISKVLLDTHKNIKTVAKKSGEHTGIYRTKRVTVLGGEDTKITTHTESGIRLLVDVEAAYFSPRLSNERLRIARQVRKNEDVLVLFSGVAPYPLVIAKNSKPKSIVGVEKNSRAHKLAKENVILNKFEDKIELIRGDVREVKLRGRKFDRVVMPLPKGGEDFLWVALRQAKKGSIIHLYLFVDEEGFPKNVKELVAKKSKRVKVSKVVQCGASSPSTIRVCADLKVV